MKTRIRLFLPAALFWLAVGFSVKADSRLTIVVNPGPFTSVEEAAGAAGEVQWSVEDDPAVHACTESFAAMELREFLGRALRGVQAEEIRFAFPDSSPGGDLWVIGSRHSNRFLDGNNPPPGDAEAFRVRTIDDGERRIVEIEGGGRVGVLYGVYAYLEELGYRFFGMAEEGVVYPEQKDELPHVDLEESPDFLIRGFMTTRRGGDLEDFFLWMARNRFNLWSVYEEGGIPLLKQLGIRLNGGLHWIQPHYLNPEAEYPYRLPWESAEEVAHPLTPYTIEAGARARVEAAETEARPSYFGVHPEWYGLVDGERQPEVARGGVNYCTSNTDASRELSKNIVASLEAGRLRHADVLELWMLDAGTWCECEPCRADGTYTDRLLLTTHRFAEAVRAAGLEGALRREIHISTLAYVETVTPPTRPLPDDFDYRNVSVTFFPFRRCYVHGLADEACEEINAPMREALEQWRGEGQFYGGSLRIGEYYNLSSYQSQPFVFSRILKEDIPYYYDSSVRHFHFMHVLHRNWGPWVLNHRLLSRLLWNRKEDVDAAKRDFLKTYYPAAHQEMAGFYRALEKATENIAAWKARVDTADGLSYDLREWLREEKNGIFALEHLAYEPDASLGTSISGMAEQADLARSYLDRAHARAEDSAEAARLRDVEERFGYGEAVMHFYHRLVRATDHHRKGEEEAARREVAPLVKWAEKLEAMEEAAQVSGGDANSPNGLIATGARPQFNRLNALYGE